MNEPDACRAAQHLLDCELPDGSHATCLSDTVECPDLDADADCHDRCATDEYAASCGTIGSATSTAEPPSGCGDPMHTPGGPAFYCCPCS